MLSAGTDGRAAQDTAHRQGRLQRDKLSHMLADSAGRCRCAFEAVTRLKPRAALRFYPDSPRDRGQQARRRHKAGRCWSLLPPLLPRHITRPRSVARATALAFERGGGQKREDRRLGARGGRRRGLIARGLKRGLVRWQHGRAGGWRALGDGRCCPPAPDKPAASQAECSRAGLGSSLGFSDLPAK